MVPKTIRVRYPIPRSPVGLIRDSVGVVLLIRPRQNMSNPGKRVIGSLVGGSILLLLLGTGNIIFANLKLSNYQVIFERVTDDLEKEGVSNPVRTLRDAEMGVNVSPNREKLSQHIERLRQRMQFYQFVSLGGKSLLGLSAILLLAAILLRGTFRYLGKPVDEV